MCTYLCIYSSNSTPCYLSDFALHLPAILIEHISDDPSHSGPHFLDGAYMPAVGGASGFSEGLGAWDVDRALMGNGPLTGLMAEKNVIFTTEPRKCFNLQWAEPKWTD